MTRRKSPESPTVIRQGRSLGNGERTVIRTDEEPSPAERFWRAEDGRRPRFHRRSKKLHGQLMAGLTDEEFLISMRNRLRFLEHERAAPAFWRRFKGLLFGSSEDNSMAGIEINRLKQLAGETPAELLPAHRSFALPYEEFVRILAAAEKQIKAVAASSAPQGGADDAG